MNLCFLRVFVKIWICLDEVINIYIIVDDPGWDPGCKKFECCQFFKISASEVESNHYYSTSFLRQRRNYVHIPVHVTYLRIARMVFTFMSRDLYRVTPPMTEGLFFFCLIRTGLYSCPISTSTTIDEYWNFLHTTCS